MAAAILASRAAAAGAKNEAALRARQCSGRDLSIASGRDLSVSGRDISISGFSVDQNENPLGERRESHDSLRIEIQRETSKSRLLRQKSELRPNSARAVQRKLRTIYETPLVQMSVAALIAINFVVSAVEAQMRWSTQSSDHPAFFALELLFTAAFTIELLCNMAAYWCLPFWRSGWNIFDFAIVSIAWISISSDALLGISVLRLFRAFRVFRLFKRIESLRSIIEGVLNAMPAVGQAFVVLAILMGIWSIIGVEFFREDAPEEFGTFAHALFTLWQVMVLDSWAGIARDLMFPEVSHGDLSGIRTHSGSTVEGSQRSKHLISAPIFFVSYTFVAAIVMSNIVIAMLLDYYLKAMDKIQEEKKDRKQLADEEAARQKLEVVRYKERAALRAREEEAADAARADALRSGAVLSAEELIAVGRKAAEEVRRQAGARLKVLSPIKAAAEAPRLCSDVLANLCSVDALIQLPRDELLMLVGVLYAQPLCRPKLLAHAAATSELKATAGTVAGDLVGWLAAQHAALERSSPADRENMPPGSQSGARRLARQPGSTGADGMRRRRSSLGRLLESAPMLAGWQISRGFPTDGSSGTRRVLPAELDESVIDDVPAVSKTRI